ncbi:macrophage mannose receptor 1-like [Polypterus senegalus]|uniref:macrophage mannose receptor 1-like n=1 Tax=Polypterus senegalus TaxID=55291 RepID=UPI0019651373|nr:macrophage mannose receptor 1-like [Polypterus senegalus]
MTMPWLYWNPVWGRSCPHAQLGRIFLNSDKNMKPGIRSKVGACLVSSATGSDSSFQLPRNRKNEFRKWMGGWINMLCSILMILVGIRLSVLPVHGLQEFYYHYGNYQMNWTNAQNYCRSNFTDLVTIANNEELKEILDMLTKENVSNEEIWIGLKDINMTNGTWSNGETFTYRNWNEKEPNNNKIACGTMYYQNKRENHNGTWNDCGCNNIKTAICYAVKRKFHAVNTSMSWLSALQYCNSNYTGMATIRSEREEWHLLKHLNESNIQEKVWLGMRSSRVFGFWFWMNDDPVTYQNWVNDSSGAIQDNLDCATLDLNQTKWVRKDCAEEAPFVCYTAKQEFMYQKSLFKHWARTQTSCAEPENPITAKKKETLGLQNLMQHLRFRIFLNSDKNMKPGIRSKVGVCLVSSATGSDSSFQLPRNGKNEIRKCMGGWINMLCSILMILVGVRLSVLPVHGHQEFYYHYGNYQMNWTNAQNYCRSNFNDLVTIANNEELKEILDMLTGTNVSNEEIWIGLKDIALTSGTWSNGETFTYRNWKKGEPDNSNIACGTMYYHRKEVNHNGTWNDCGCQYTKPFVCYAVKRKFHAVNTAMTWVSAFQYCNSYYNGLATIRSGREEWHLLKHLNETNIQEKVWIGMRSSMIFGHWFWMNDDPINYQNWVNDTSEGIRDTCFCTSLDPNQKKWVRQACAERAPFVCYTGISLFMKRN